MRTSFDLAPGYAALAELPRRRRRKAVALRLWLASSAVLALGGVAAAWLLR